MKIKIILISAILSLVIFSAKAQKTFTSMDRVGQIGLGLGSYFGSGSYKTTFPTTSLSYEFGILDNLFDENSALGLGAFAGYGAGEQSLQVGWQDDSSVKYKHRFFLLGGRANLHYQFVEKLDTYGGLSLGYNLSTSKYDGPNVSIIPEPSKVGGFLWGLYIGGRYYFLPQIAGFAELGYGVSPVTIGLAIKM